MKEVERHSVIGYGRQDINYKDPEGEFVYYEDYTALQQQLTATTNSLTNAQEALKSAGIEADTVQVGVMELKAERDALAAENAALKEAIESHKHGFVRCECCGEENMCHNDDVCRALDETPATDAYLNAVRAEGADAAAAKIRKAITAFKDIHCGAVKECADIAEMVAVQFTTGNAGKDGV